MDRLWTPWRFDYLRSLDPAPKGCVFCDILGARRDEENLILHRSPRSFVVLNLFPYATGHLLVVLNRHIASLRDAQTDELHELAELARRCEIALGDEYRPDGYNLGFNLGRAAGAGVEHHIHMHVLPRWIGDANFVSVIGETRILPEQLPRTWQRLRPYFS